jgi:peptidyl-prolyl cis-trans isomerase C
MGSGGDALGGGALTGGALTGGGLTGGALTGGGFTRGAACADCEPAGSSSVGPLASGRSTSSVTNRLAKKPVSAKTTSAGVSIFWADASGARLLESGG